MKPEWHAEGTHAWDMKHLIRTIVTEPDLPAVVACARRSWTSAIPTTGCWRARAVSAWMPKWSATSRSRSPGLLVEKFGGPSAKPYEPDGYLATLNFPKREYSASHGDDLYRRGVYTFWQRTFLHPSLLTFDAPTREECTINRVEFQHAAAGAGAAQRSDLRGGGARVRRRHILQAADASRRAIDWAFERARRPAAYGGGARAFSRTCTAQSLAEFRRSPADAASLIHAGEAPVAANLKPAELAAMTTVARAILNLHETITRN